MKKMIVLAMVITAFCGNQIFAAGYTLAISSTDLAPGERFKIFWTAPKGTPTSDWIGIYPATGTPSNFVYRVTTSGATSGVVTAELVLPRSYLVGYFQNGGFVDMVSPVAVDVHSANESYNFTVTPTSVDQDDLVVVSWNITTNVNITNDRIGYYRVTTNATTSVIQYIVLPPGFYSGSAWFTMFAPPGDYAFQYFKHGAPSPTNAVLTPIVVHVAPAPAALSIKLLSTNSAGLTWDTKIGTVYTVQSIQYLTDLANTWETVTSVYGDGKSVLIPVPRTNNSATYRLLEH